MVAVAVMEVAVNEVLVVVDRVLQAMDKLASQGVCQSTLKQAHHVHQL